jgi:hypothetical protein
MLGLFKYGELTYSHKLVSRPRYADRHWLYYFALCELKSTVISPFAKWRQLYYTSCWRRVRSGTKLYCFTLCKMNSTVLHVLSTGSLHLYWTVLFPLVRTEVNCISPYANWRQLYYTSCWRKVRTCTKATPPASVPTQDKGQTRSIRKPQPCDHECCGTISWRPHHMPSPIHVRAHAILYNLIWKRNYLYHHINLSHAWTISALIAGQQ